MRDLFGEYYKPSDEEFSHLWQEATFVFDTNVLLNLYRYTPSTRDDLLHIMEKLQQRIWLPHQVGWEFSKDRVSVIEDQNKIFNLIDAFNTFVNEKFTKDIVQKCGKRGHFFADLEKLQAIFEQTKQALQDELQNARVQHPDPLDHDLVFERLDKLFKGKIGNPYSDEELAQLSIDFSERYKRQVPPGYKDANKQSEHQNDNSDNPGNKYGDVIIWFQMINYAKQENRPIIFVIDDVKEDWWIRARGKTVGPRAELRQEMRKKANILFYMYTSDNFIQKAQEFLQVQVQEKTIEEVRENRIQEAKQHLYPNPNLYPSPTLYPGSTLYPTLATMRDIARHGEAVRRIVDSLGGPAELQRQIQQQQRFLRQMQHFLPPNNALGKNEGNKENYQIPDDIEGDQDPPDHSLDDSSEE